MSTYPPTASLPACGRFEACPSSTVSASLPSNRVTCHRPHFPRVMSGWGMPAPGFHVDLARWTAVHTERTMPLVIVGAAIIADGRVLACARSEPPEMAGKWEFPGGKVEPGEDDITALIRECVEELGVRVEVGDRVGEDVLLGHGRALLRVYAA